MALTIEELSVQTKVNPSTIRYYERRGVLPAPRQSNSGSREYGDVDIGRVKFVRSSRHLGIELAEIRALIEMIGEGNAEEIDVAEQAMLDRVARLERFRAALREVSAAIRAGEIKEADAFGRLSAIEEVTTDKSPVEANIEDTSKPGLATPTPNRKRAKS